MSAASRREPAGLTGVPETMLWTLHSRASEALRADGVIRDPMAVEIHRAMNYDFTRNFGRADPILAMRAALFDALLRAFLERHPRAVIVNLGEGLETQRYRIEAPEALWYSVDLPEAIAIRERFITPDERHRHLAGSALARDWMQAIPRGRPIYISAQGLFMYFSAPAVRTLLRTIRDELAPHTVVFDVIPGWLSSLSRAAGGLRRTPRYRTPRMPWGVSRYRLRPLLQRWLGEGTWVRLHDYPDFPRGIPQLAGRVLDRLPALSNWGPTIVEVGGWSANPAQEGS